MAATAHEIARDLMALLSRQPLSPHETPKAATDVISEIQIALRAVVEADLAVIARSTNG